MKPAWLAFLVAATALPSTAQAFEGLCRQDTTRAPANSTTLDRLTGLDAYISSANPGPADRPARCEEGVGYARGVQLGEHTWLTADGMALAGIPAGVIHGDDVFARPPGRARPPGYYVSGAKVALSNSLLTSLEPAGAGGMAAFQERRVSIAEFSEFADGSLSVSGYILGNEHCLAAELTNGQPSVSRSTLAQVNACHTFKKQLATLNAAHWPPLHREMYRRYHAIALSVAASCKRMHDEVRRVGSTNPLRQDVGVRVLACEREALAFEAYATHFLQDAWASGHMWVRWGGARFEPTPEGQVRAWTAGALTGFIHGSRSLFGEDDQANMPGPRDPSDATTAVRWRYPARFDAPGLQGPTVFTDSATHHGGGDLYLRPGTAHGSAWAVSTGPELAVQYGRMRLCVAAGFREVLAAGPLQLLDGQMPAEPRVDPRFFSSFPRAESAGCWAARLTNRSMYLGLGSPIPGPDISAEDLTDPGPVTRMVLRRVIRTATEELPATLGSTQIDRLNRELQTEAVRLSTYMIQQSRRSPDAVSLASDGQADPQLRQVFGVRSSDQFVGDIAANRVPYLEHDRSQTRMWSDAPASATRCVTDNGCPTGHYCDRTAVAGGAGGTFVEPRCVRHEGAVLRAFRVAETPHWCTATSSADVDQAAWLCTNSGRDYCEPCADLVMPLLRNAASADVYTGFTRQSDQRSLCDVIGATPTAPRYAPFNSADQARRRAEAICRGHPFISLAGRWRAVVPQGGGFELDATGAAEGDVRFVYATVPAGSPFRVGATSMEGRFTNFNQTFGGEIVLTAPSGATRRVRVSLTASADGMRLRGTQFSTPQRAITLERIGGEP